MLLAFPLAYVIAFKAGRYKNLILGLVILPFFVTFLIRTIAWKTILADDGWVVSALGAVGLLPERGATALDQLGRHRRADLQLDHLHDPAALCQPGEDRPPTARGVEGPVLAATPQAFSKVILPLAMPGVLAGSMLVFIPAVGDFINADYLGSTQTTMIGNVIQKQFLVVKDYPAAAALSFVLMALILVGVLLYTRALGTGGPGVSGQATWREATESAGVRANDSQGHASNRGDWQFLRTCAQRLVLLFLFLPIFVIILFSFNKPAGKFNYTWQGFTLDNWADPFKYPALTEALKLSLNVAAVSTAIALVLGTLVAIALVRQRFRGRSAVDTFLILPLTAPEVVMGASLLTLFLDLGWAAGYTTILIAHVAFEISFIAMTVRARVRGFDWTLEDASMDLGAGPMRTFFKVTLPLIVPGIIAAAMLSFALSLDDFIITYFVSGSTVTYPLYVNAAIKAAVPPQINVLATAILVISLILLAAGTLYRRKRLPA